MSDFLTGLAFFLIIEGLVYATGPFGFGGTGEAIAVCP